MGYILEFKDDFEKQEVIDKLYKLKEDICDICEMLEDADPEGEEEQMNERGRMSRRGARMRDERMMRSGEGMNYRRGRNGRYM
jgi:hypothetical protein